MNYLNKFQDKQRKNNLAIRSKSPKNTIYEDYSPSRQVFTD